MVSLTVLLEVSEIVRYPPGARAVARVVAAVKETLVALVLSAHVLELPLLNA